MGDAAVDAGSILREARRFRTAHEYVKSELRSAILSGRFPVEHRLVQSEIASKLGVSATPVREALRDLATEGLVVLDPHHGAIVRSLRLSEVEEIYQLRMTLEPLMVDRVIDKITEECLGRATELYEAMETEMDMARWSELNWRFHSIFAEPDAESRLASILANLRDSASPYVTLSLVSQPARIRQSNGEHALLIEHYRKRDTEAAIALTVKHLQETLDVIAETHGA